MTMTTTQLEPVHPNARRTHDACRPSRRETGRRGITNPDLQPVIQVTDMVKDYSRGDSVVHALRSVSLQVQTGEFVAVMGPSGSGKSTFMNMLGCLDRPTSGSYVLDGVEVTRLKRKDLADLRGKKLG